MITLMVVAIVVPAAWVAYFGGKSGFVFDDFRNFRDAQLDGLSLDYLLHPVGDFYFSPGHRFGNWVIHTFFPMNFSPAHLFTVATFTVSIFLLYLILIELSRPGVATLLLTALYGISVIQIEVSHWWTSALQVFPATLFSFLCILCYIRFQRTGRRALVGLSIAALIIGLLFHSKTAYVPLYLMLIRIFLLQADVPLRTAVSTAVREWRVWLAYLVPVVVFMTVFLSMFAGGTPSLRSLVRYLSILWFRVFVPGLFGALIEAGPLSTLAVAGIVVAQIVFVGVAAWALVRVPGAWRAGIVFAIVFLVNAVPIGLTRIASPLSTPEDVAHGLRYNVEATYMFVIVVAFVLERTPRPGTEQALGARRVVSVLGVMGYVVLAFVGARTLSGPDWIGRRAASYVRNVQHGLRGVGYSADASAIVDDVVPEHVVSAILAPANTVSEVLPVIDGDVTVDVTGRDLLAVGEDGAVRRVVFRHDDGGDVGELVKNGSLVVGTPTAPTEQGLCLRSGKAEVLVVFTPRAPVRHGDLYVALRYSSRSRRPLVLGVEPAEGGGPARFVVMMLKDDGPQTNLFPVVGQSLTRLYIGLLADSEVCFQRLEIGQVSSGP